MNNKKAELFCKRMNNLHRFGLFKLIPKRHALLEEFKAIDCSFDNSKYRVDDTMVEFNKGTRQFEVRS